MSEQTTLILLKPDCVSKNLCGEVLHRFETAGFKIRGMNLTDPIGTALDDPTTQPLYLCDDDATVFCYPGDMESPDPFLWVSQS